MARKHIPLSQGKLERAVTLDANERDVAVSRAMRWVSAAALFELLNHAEAEHRITGYAIKGGFAVELRHYAAARTSEDIDLILVGERQAIEMLRKIMPAAWDAFQFRIKDEDSREHVVRVELKVTFNNSDWGTLKLDVIDEAIEDTERVPNIAIERYGLPAASYVACISRSNQMAQWIHCNTRGNCRIPKKSRSQSR